MAHWVMQEEHKKKSCEQPTMRAFNAMNWRVISSMIPFFFAIRALVSALTLYSYDATLVNG
jgi:hypothetical protein